jgi:hypothetical protein
MGVPARAVLSDECVDAARWSFRQCPRFTGLQLCDVRVDRGFLRVRFEGPVPDFRGPYGLIVRLPRSTDEDAWTRHTTSDSVQDWATVAVAHRAVSAHAVSLDQDRPYTSDDVWWLINDSVEDPTQPR